MASYIRHFPARAACIALALVSGLSVAHASSPDAWAEFVDNVRAKCVAAAGNRLAISHVQVDPYGSESYGIAILTGLPQGSDQVSQFVCLYNKRTEEVELGTEMPKEPSQQNAAAAPQAPVPQQVPPHCEIFSQAGFQGAQGLIIANDLIRFQPETDAARNVGKTGASRVFFDANWRNNIGSVKTSPGCTLIAWVEPDLESWNFSYMGENADMNPASKGQAGAAFCHCQP